MRFASFEAEGRASYGVATGAGIHDLGGRLGERLPTLRAYLAAAAQGQAPEPGGAIDYAEAEVTLLPPVPDPAKILCVGLNYESHRLETGRPKQDYPVLFSRFADTLIGHGAAMLRPPVSQALDFEGELAVVIGRPGLRVTEAEAGTMIAGYACFNDGSLRDFQNHTPQFLPGKNFPATGAFGPWLVTPDEVGPLSALSLHTRLNGQVVQSAPLSDLIFPVERLIAYVSSFTTLVPGDVIVTGTPGGVGFKRNPPLFMRPGDVVEVEIDRVGLLRNEIRDEVEKG